VALLALGAGTAQALGDRVDLDLRLNNGICWRPADGPANPASGNTLILMMKWVDGTWERVVGYAGGGPKTCHLARVSEGTLTDRALDVTLDVQVSGDSYVNGGRAHYRVTLARQAGGSYAGTYAGTIHGVEARGTATATVLPPRTPAAGYAPVLPGEHPRILFRKADLPALREKAKTPFGQETLAQATGPAALGLKYQLTGDADYARQAMEPIWKWMTDTIYHSAGGVGADSVSGPKCEQIALAYDLCYDAWPTDFKRRVEGYLARYIHASFHQHAFFLTSRINWHACSNYAGPIYTAAGMAGLALWGEKGPRPARPESPLAVVPIPPARDYTPGAGVPVLPLVPGKTPDRWLASAPVPLWMREDPLAALGGAEACRPKAGDSFSDGLHTMAFAPLPAECVLPDGTVDLMKYVGTAVHKEATVCFFAVLDNPARQTLRVAYPNAGLTHPEFIVNGRRVAVGQLVTLEPGRYPFLVIFRGSAKGTTPGFSPMAARLDPVTDEEAQAARATQPALDAEYQAQLRDWTYDVAEWERLGGVDVGYQKLFLESWTGVYLHFREGMGTGGFQAEVGHYSLNASRPPAHYALAYRTMFGVSPSPYDDVTAFLPRKMFGHVYRPDGRAVAQDISGDPSVDLNYYASLYPLVRDEWKPAALWAWQYSAGKSGVASGDPLRAFITYPLDARPQPPQGIMPLTWEAPTFGYYGFRSAWRGTDDFILQVFLKANPVGGWSAPNAGTFRLQGLGHAWAHGPEARERDRWLENVVQLPEDTLNLGACGRLTYLKTAPDGSGALSLNLDDVYADAKTTGLYEAYGGGRRAERLVPSGVTGLRAIGVDYSGKAGVPCLLAVVDRIQGGKSKLWMWHLGGETGTKPDPDDHLKHTTVDSAAGTFTIRKPDGATLRATFIAPARPTIVAEARKIVFHNSHSGDITVTLPAVYASGADPASGDFFAVVTIGRGDPPAVAVQGTGLNARITIGGRTVRFDGEKITFADAP
jgi:hypothetical protein